MGQMSNPDDAVVAEVTEPAPVETEPAAEPAPGETEPAAEPAPVETETAAELESVEPEPTVAAEPTPDMPPHQRFELAADREAAFAAAQAALAEGRCIVLPTDTVYGIGADAIDRIVAQLEVHGMTALGEHRDIDLATQARTMRQFLRTRYPEPSPYES